MQNQIVNLCRTDHMSICMANSHHHQHDCIFYEKAFNANRCMYFVFDEYCDCLNAQLDARRLAP
jgi:hypothetical protein